MGFIGNTVKKSVKKLRDKYQKYKNKIHRTDHDDSECNGDNHIYEEIPTFSQTSTNAKISFLPKAPSRPVRRKLNNFSSSAGNTNSSLDSGISESDSPKKKPKKLQFTTAFVHEFERDTLERNSAPASTNTRKRMRAAGLYKARCYEIPSPKEVKIINNLSAQSFTESDHSLHYLDPRDLIMTSTDYSVPIGTQKPAKPPRFSQIHCKESFQSPMDNNSPTNTDTFGYPLPYIDDLEASVKSFKGKITYDVTSSSSLDTNDLYKTFSAPSKALKRIPEPIYAQITPRSSRDLLPLNFSTPISSTHSSPYPRSDTTPDRSYKSIFSPEAASSCHNEILTKETKESLNLIHQTNFLNLKGDVEEHDCQMKAKNVQEAALDKKFVVNMFESRPSKRWEKHVRDSDKRLSDSFQKRAFIRMSLDSKTLHSKIDQNIEMLETESKKLQVETKNIKRELIRMLRENKAQTSYLNSTSNEEDSLINQHSDNKEDENELMECDRQNNDQYQRYRLLKKARDVECSRMTQASKALQEIKIKKGKKDWLELLVAEKVLLETSERVKILTQEIRENSYSSIPEPPLHKGTLRLSDIKYPFAKRFQEDHKSEKHFTQFFLMTISHGTQMFVSEFTTGEEDPLSFNHEYTFVDVAPDFEIKVKLFCLRIRTSEFFWEKFTCSGCCATSRIVYEDYLTHQYEEKTVFQTSFKLCAETTLTSAQINESFSKLNTQPLVYGKLEGIVEHHFKCRDVDMTVSLSGFLDVGSLFGETYFWERKWCTLKGPNLLIYNYPQEEHFGRPAEQINLEYCFGPILTRVDNCPKARCFQLKTGRPNDVASSNVNTLKTKPNFALRKFYFATRTREEYAQWTEEVGKLLDSLRYFKKLVFEEEYDYYSGR